MIAMMPLPRHPGTPSAGKWWAILSLYPLGGLALGLADHLLGRGAQGLGMRPGVATAASVNVLLPLIVVGLAAAYPKLGTAWLGAVALTFAFVLGLALIYPQGHRWDALALIRSVPPVRVMACLGYLFLGTLSALVARSIGSRNRFGPPTRTG
jgi:hypothetical protein